ncbi:MAG: hypothetical protein H6Q89_2642 [Myxococcaceae bacterium]|nr:hypothetical protein [Myxococcaceae bacterium]
MKIIGALFPGRSTAQTRPSFSQALQRLPPPLPKKPAAGTQPAAANKLSLPSVAPRQAPVTTAAAATQQVFSTHQKTTATLGAARASAHQSIAQLQEARVAHHQVASERLDGRLVDLICKELVIEFTADASSSRVANQDLPLAPPTPSVPSSLGAGSARANAEHAPAQKVDGSVRAAQAVELIEKIERFVKDSRTPCIALTLNNSLGAKVEIERVGPREVALKVIGHRGPPRAEDIGRIRDEMAAHGLKVCALSVA